jgi:hypothetical protein
MPSLIAAFNSIIVGILTVLVDNAPKIIQAGFQILLDLLKGIADNIGAVVAMVARIVVNFLNALASHIGEIVAAGVNLLFKFLEGVARAAGSIPGEVIKIIGIFLSSLFGNFGKIFSGGAALLGKLVGGILSGIGRMASAAVSLIGRFLSGLAGRFGAIAAEGAKMIGRLVSGALGAVAGAAGKLASAGWDLAKHLADGMIGGIKSMAGKVAGAAGNLASSAYHKVTHFLGIGGPSKLFEDVGHGIGEGTINGLEAIHDKVVASTEKLGSSSVLAMRKTIAGLSDAISRSDLNLEPTIRPVLDLSQVQKDSTQIGNIMNAVPISVGTSYSQAQNISAQQLAAVVAANNLAQESEKAPTTVNFNQNNYSPKALSTVDIYRQSKNLLSQQKQALGIPIKTF